MEDVYWQPLISGNTFRFALLPDAHWDIKVESRLINLRCQVGVGF